MGEAWGARVRAHRRRHGSGCLRGVRLRNRLARPFRDGTASVTLSRLLWVRRLEALKLELLLANHLEKTVLRKR
jgi:hypothetical protein